MWYFININSPTILMSSSEVLSLFCFWSKKNLKECFLLQNLVTNELKTEVFILVTFISFINVLMLYSQEVFYFLNDILSFVFNKKTVNR